MKIDSIMVGPIMTNCYLLSDETAGVCALIDPGDEADRVLDMVLHRAESHSLLYLTLLAGPLGWLAAWATSTPRLRGRWMLALFAALFTHPLLDLMTVYGTQVLQPFTDEAYGVGSLFIIDPLFLLPWLLAFVVAMAVPRSPQTHHLLNADRLGRLKSTAIVINAGRGDAIDPEALADALHNGRLHGAGLDVTEPEPLPAESPLWDEPHCLITPHVAGGNHLEKTSEHIIRIALTNVSRYAKQQELLNLVRY